MKLILLLLLTTFGFTSRNCLPASQSGVSPREREQAPRIPGTIKLDLGNRGLSAILAEIARQVGRGIIAEGDPIASSAIQRVEGPRDEVLSAVADAYDYTWKLSRSGVILMSKRFRSADNYPGMSLEEMTLMLRDVVAALEALPYDRSESAVSAHLTDFYHRLKPEQQAVLKKGDPLYLRNLHPSQANLLESAILSSTYGSIWNQWSIALDCAEGLASSSLFLRQSEPTEAEPKLILGSSMDDRALYRFDCAFIGRRTKRDYQIPLLLVQAPKEMIKPSSQTGSATTPTKPGRPDSSGEMTIGALMARTSDVTGQRTVIQPGLQTRRVIAHLADSDRNATLDAIKELFDWQLTRQGQEVIRLSRKRVTRPRASAEMPSAIQAALTVDFRKFLGIGVPLAELPALPDSSLGERIEKYKQDRSDPFIHRTVLTALTPARFERIAMRVRTSLFADLQRELFAGERFSYSALSSDHQRQLTMGLLLQLLSSTNTHFNVWNDQLPDYHRDRNLLEIRLNGSGIAYGCRMVVNGVPMFVGGGGQINLEENKWPLERAPH